MKNPIKFTIKTEIWPLLILAVTIGLSIWAYPQLPEKVVSHWNFNGQPNGWSTKQFHSIFFPALLVAIYGLFSFMPRLDPKGERYKDFSGAYLMMRTAILFMLYVVFAAATFSNLGYAVNIGGIVSGAVGLLMIIMGNYFGKLKRNWFVGIRTPWTLSSENVWNKTHRLGGRLFMIWGFCLIFAPWLPSTIAFIILIGGLAAIISWVFAYSYIQYKREKKQ